MRPGRSLSRWFARPLPPTNASIGMPSSVPALARGVWAVPPLARHPDQQRSLALKEEDRIVSHVADAGIDRILFGGNAFLYHITLSDYEELLDWAADLSADLTVVPSAGPAYGRAMDQAPFLRRHDFPAVMMLPCRDPRTAEGIAHGVREFVDAAETPVILYLKSEANFGDDLRAGFEAIHELVEDGSCVAIKYAVSRENPVEDRYLEELLTWVDRERVISGLGERPAIVHMKTFGLAGFTTGSGCLQPRLCRELFEACRDGEYVRAHALREHFLPMEDLRDAWGPDRVLHEAVSAADIAETGPVLPFLSELNDVQVDSVRPDARKLAGLHQEHA